MVQLVLSGRLTLCLTDAVRAEYRDVLFRAKFAAFHAKAAELLAALERVAMQFAPGPRLAGAKDEDDNRFLECAVAADAQWLVTGNLKHYPAQWESLGIVNARGFLTLHPDLSI